MTSCVSVAQAVAATSKQLAEVDVFFGHGTDNAQDEALWLVLNTAGISFAGDESVLQAPLSDQHWQKIQQLTERRSNERLPLAYLLGEAWFCGYPFVVNPSVLIPRSPIAELIQQQFYPWLRVPPATVLDMCTGGGCIGIATALQLPGTIVDLVDISYEALQVARDNIFRHHVHRRVHTIESDLFAALQGKAYDLIIANPPYVDESDLASMPAEYQAEPAIALGSGDDGLDITRRLLVDAPHYLTGQGIMIVEVGNSWINLERAFPRVPFLWLEFESGGHGVFVITKSELQQYRAEFV